MDLEIALEFVNRILKNKVNRGLRPPEVTVFCGTWQGVTYEQMADSSAYSANYLMRDIAPKFWKLLSTIFGESIGKSNLKIQLCKFYDSSHTNLRALDLLDPRSADAQERWLNTIASPSVFYGRKREIETIYHWATKEQAQLIELWGLSGMGKTLLMKKAGEELQAQYEVVIWRSLASAPKLNELVESLLAELGIVGKNSLTLLSTAIEQMRLRRCLIMLDGVESILQPQEFSGQYRAGYEDYQEFFQTVGSSSHQSCVVATSLENFGRTMLANSNTAIRQLQLTGLSPEASRAIFTVESAASESEAVLDPIKYYQGNPAILSFVAQIIHQLFNGNIAEFQAQKSLVFGEVYRLLDKSFDRLSTLEQEILYWLASEVKPMSLQEIQSEIPLSIYPVELIEALESLNRRSLIEATQIAGRSVFALSPMVREFTIDKFIAQIGNDFSLVNRRSALSQKTIELGSSERINHLSLWFQNRFEPNWQPVETLFTASGRSPARLRSAFSLRGNDVVKRFKQIELGTDNPIKILLVVAVSQLESAFKICVQAQPALQQRTLPENLELSLIDPENQTLAKIVTQAEDNFIQLPYFRGAKAEKFGIGIDLDSRSHYEKFLI